MFLTRAIICYWMGLFSGLLLFMALPFGDDTFFATIEVGLWLAVSALLLLIVCSLLVATFKSYIATNLALYCVSFSIAWPIGILALAHFMLVGEFANYSLSEIIIMFGKDSVILYVIVTMASTAVAGVLFLFWNHKRPLVTPDQDEHSDSSNILTAFSGSWLSSVLLVSLLLPVFIVPAMPGTTTNPFSTELVPLADGLISILGYGLAFAALLFAVARKSRQFRIPAEPRLSIKQTIFYACLAIPLVGSALGFLFAIYLPLSFVWPDGVYSWILEPIPIIHWKPGTGALVGSALNVLVAVILAPIVEELFFRGFLLHRWANKFGTSKAIFFSSLIFGIAHADAVGAFFFGAILCLIHLRTGSLLVPIIIHIANNAIAVSVEVIEHFVYPPGYIYSLEDFRSDWHIGIIGAVIAIPWLTWYWRKHLAPVKELLASARAV